MRHDAHRKRQRGEQYKQPSAGATTSRSEYPKPDILVVPGGGVPRHQDKPNVIKWLQGNAQPVETVLSVCNGAFFLAKAGLLDGQEATTFAPLIDGLQAAAPKAQDAAKSNGTVKSLWQFSGKDGKIWNNETLQARRPSYP